MTDKVAKGSMVSAQVSEEVYLASLPLEARILDFITDLFL
jgi:hypothetical protein